MVAVAENYPSAGVVSSYLLHGQNVESTGLPTEQTLVSGREACRQFLLQTYCLFGTQNSVLYRADLVRSRNPFYIETNMCADFEACFALLRTSDLGFVHEVLTFSRRRAGSIGAIAYDIGANFRSLLDILFGYGRQCLSGDEFEKSLDLQLSQYYRFLGRRLWVERDHDFWSFHKKTFANAGINFSRARLARAAVGQLCASVLDPRATAESVKRLFSLRRIRNRQTRSVVSSFGAHRIGDGDQAKGRL
jgi:hypothetical protein